MAFPTNVLALADAIGSQFLSVFFGGSVSHSSGINQIKADLVAVEEKVGTGASTATANTVLGGTGTGTTAFTGAPTVASLTATGALQAGTTIKAGTKIYPGTLNGPSTGVQSSANFQVAYINGSLGANTSTTISSFPIGAFNVFNLTSAHIGHFDSNSVSTLVDQGSNAGIQIGGADPGASSSKLWISLSSGTLTIYNRFASAQSIQILGHAAA